MRLQPLPARVDNYIWIARDAADRALVVDPTSSQPVEAAAAGEGFTPVAILLTHHHDDHIAGAASLLQRWPGLPVYGPDDDRIGVPTHRVRDGDRFDVAGWRISALDVPGHTNSHVAFVVEDDEDDAPALFCGDTLFSLGCGRLFEGTPGEMAGSLAKLAALPPATRVCCGHEYTLANAAFAAAVEPENTALRRRIKEARTMRDAHLPTLPSTIASELECNPFLRCDQPAVLAAAAARLGRAPTDRAETFGVLRSWKDGFQA